MGQYITLKGQLTGRQDLLKALILLGLGLYFIALIITGNISNYINLRFIWLIYVGAALFIGLGLWSVIRLNIGHSAARTSPYTPISWGGILMLAVPLFFATLLPSQPLGADAISGGISLAPIGGVSAEARYDIPPLDRNVLDWLRAFDAADNPAELDGLPVDVVAFVYREPDMTSNQFMAARFTLSCCVADAFAIGMPVMYEDAQDLADGAWIRIRGQLEAGMFRNEQVPIIIPASVEPTETPRNPYLYS